MDATALMAISPLDGRYQEKVTLLRPIFSEYGLIKFRLLVEVRWLEMLAEFGQMPELKPLSSHAKKLLHDMVANFSEQDAIRVKHIESGINHDVKAVEYFIKERLAGNKELAEKSEFIHFGCTSEDINNLAYGLMLETARKQCLLPAYDDLINLLRDMAHRYADVAMLARTHGQPATPTTVGKEIANVIARLQAQIQHFSSLPIYGKLNGASGNYNAFCLTQPKCDWQVLSKKFINHLGLSFNPYTTQIEPHDGIADYCHALARINTIFIDFTRDMWGYIALNYFQLKTVSNEVGSSTMPHKVNPIDFENAEGNLGLANALCNHFAAKLPISRWQRDLSDSTVLRNMGVAIGHTALAYQAIMKGLAKVEPNLDVIKQDLAAHWEILGEAIQTVMRRYGIEEPYEKLKAFTRGKAITQSMLQDFIKALNLNDSIKVQLLELTPDQYIGYARDLAMEI